jgi:Glycosyl hydrolases family 43
MPRTQFVRPSLWRPFLFAIVAVALVATACLPPKPPPPPLPTWPAAPVGQSTAGATIQYPPPPTSWGALVGDFPDPDVITVGNEYYAYSTGSLVTWAKVQVMKSPDLVHWTFVGDAFDGPNTTPTPGNGVPQSGSGWSQLFFGRTWGPAVMRLGNQYVMYYAAESDLSDATDGFQCIGRATSASPEGPFLDDQDHPLICSPAHGGSIDPEPFVSNGTVYLLWKSEGTATEPTRIWSTPLTPDGLAVAAPAAYNQLLETFATNWEAPIVESPTMMPAPDGSGFLLFYSAAQWETADYKVGVATCATPTSPCYRIYSTPVLATRGDMLGPGGPHVFQDLQGHWQLAFASWTGSDVGYVNSGGMFPEPDTDRARSFHVLPITFPAGGHNPQIG